MNTSAWNLRAKFAYGILTGMILSAAPARATVLVPDVASLEDARFSGSIVAQRVLMPERARLSETPAADLGFANATISPLASGSAQEFTAITRDEWAAWDHDRRTVIEKQEDISQLDIAVLALGRPSTKSAVHLAEFNLSDVNANAAIEASQSKALANSRSGDLERIGTMLAVVGFSQ